MKGEVEVKVSPKKQRIESFILCLLGKRISYKVAQRATTASRTFNYNARGIRGSSTIARTEKFVPRFF